MTLSRKLRATVSAISAAAGIACAALPDDWIERGFGISPDGGNSGAEFLWVAAPLALAAILALSLLRDPYPTAS
jgi:hypothetical protein